MFRIECPFCGVRDYSEFFARGSAEQLYPQLDASTTAWEEAVYLRQNNCGVVKEFYQHQLGCRQWLVVERNNQTHQIIKVMAARELSMT